MDHHYASCSHDEQRNIVGHLYSDSVQEKLPHKVKGRQTEDRKGEIVMLDEKLYCVEEVSCYEGED